MSEASKELVTFRLLGSLSERNEMREWLQTHAPDGRWEVEWQPWSDGAEHNIEARIDSEVAVHFKLRFVK